MCSEVVKPGSYLSVGFDVSINFETMLVIVCMFSFEGD